MSMKLHKKFKTKLVDGITRELHGPYWYEYRKIDGKVVSRYIGKDLKGKKAGQ